MASTSLQPIALTPEIAAPARLPVLPWRDPHTVSPAELAKHIDALEAACLDNPASADLRTVLGMAYAMNFDVYKSMDALEAAVALEPENFLAQLKCAELQYRLRALERAEAETVKALDLASNGWELSMARKQLQEIRRLRREGTQKPTWTKSLVRPALTLLLISVVLSAATLWK